MHVTACMLDGAELMCNLPSSPQPSQLRAGSGRGTAVQQGAMRITTVQRYGATCGRIATPWIVSLDPRLGPAWGIMALTLLAWRAAHLFVALRVLAASPGLSLSIPVCLCSFARPPF